jgi:hypothetical protein
MDLKERMKLGCEGCILVEILWNCGAIFFAVMDREWWISFALLLNIIVFSMVFYFLNEEPVDFVEDEDQWRNILLLMEEDWDILFNPHFRPESDSLVLRGGADV